MSSISGHIIHAYLCHKHYFSFIPILYYVERHSTRYICECGLLVKIWWRLSTYDQLLALACLAPHAFGFHAVAKVVGCRVYLVEIMSSGYAPKYLLPSSCAEMSSLCAEILAQVACYAGRFDSNMDFSSLAPYFRFQDNSLTITDIHINVFDQNKLAKQPNLTYP